MKAEDDVFYGMKIENKRIKAIYRTKEEFDQHSAFKKNEAIDLESQHVYPCLIDGHIHMFMTIVNMAVGFYACEITEDGITPNTLAGVESKIRKYASRQKQDAIISVSNFIMSAMEERRLPTRYELDEWAGGRPVVVYNIDGHSCVLSTKMMKLIGLNSENHNGILTGEENERNQGKIIDTICNSINFFTIAKGVAAFHNYCGQYGINIVGALEGYGDSENDTTTDLIIKLAQHFDVGVRIYLQYSDLDRVKKYASKMKNLRIGGCGDWEMDGSSGSHSAAFSLPYKDTKEIGKCYYEQDFINLLCKNCNDEGYQIAAHAIGDKAIEQIIDAFDGLKSSPNRKVIHRIEHCEFGNDESVQKLKAGKYAIMFQPGYSWIDKRYLHTYEQVLENEIISKMKLKTYCDAGVCICGSSDSPVQEMNPFLQMLGMVQFYNEDESITPYEAMKSYTVNAARAIMEADDYGSLEEGKIADFFTADRDFFNLGADEIMNFMPTKTYYGGSPYKKKKGTVVELIRMMLSKEKKV